MRHVAPNAFSDGFSGATVAPKVAPNKLLGATYEVFGATIVAPDDVFCPNDPAASNLEACSETINIFFPLGVPLNSNFSPCKG